MLLPHRELRRDAAGSARSCSKACRPSSARPTTSSGARCRTTINENGGIAGIVYYGITRAEDDPRYAAAENWEPGIPRVQVNVFLDCDGDGKPDKPQNNGTGLVRSGVAD